jgi:hypothetical protein
LAYAALLLGQTTVLGGKELWKARAPRKCHFFVWLVLLNSRWTVERWHQHSIRSNDDCILCCQQVKTVDYMVVQCVFSREVWFKSLQHCGWQDLVPGLDSTFSTWWISVCKHVHQPRRKAFGSLVVAVVWASGARGMIELSGWLANLLPWW